MKKAKVIILECLKEKGLTQSELARSMDEDVRSLNQQLNKQKDFKVSRFADIMEYIGYDVDCTKREYRKVSRAYGKKIIENGCPLGLFWYEADNGFVAICNGKKNQIVKNFSSRDVMMKWFRAMIKHA